VVATRCVLVEVHTDVSVCLLLAKDRRKYLERFPLVLLALRIYCFVLALVHGDPLTGAHEPRDYKENVVRFMTATQLRMHLEAERFRLVVYVFLSS
jgi:hypothetical protein